MTMKPLRGCLLLAAAVPLFAQQPPPPDCRQTFSFTSANADSPTFDNRTTGCDTWTIVYQVDGYSAVSLTVQSATGVNSPAAFTTFAGTVGSGINPNTSTTGAETRLQGFVSWIRVDLAGTISGAQILTGQLYGYKSGYPGGGVSGGSGCPGTVGTPCVVTGPAAVGAAPAGAPVSIGTTDGSVIRRALSDSSGRLIVNVNGTVPISGPVVVTQSTPANLQAQVTGAAAAGSPLAGKPVLVCGSDGTNCQSLLVDSSGRLIVNVNGTVPISGPVVVTQSTPANLQALVTGAAADGAPVAGNPNLTAGSDGTDARTLLTDASGRLAVNVNGTVPISGPVVVTQSTPANLQALVTGAAGNGAPVSGNPVLVGGSDGTGARTFATNLSGDLKVSIDTVNGTVPVSGGVVNGATVAGLLTFLTAGADPTNIRTFLTDTGGRSIVALSTSSAACPNQAQITGSGTTGIRIITGTVGTTVRICHLDFALDGAANVTVQQGTGSVCGSSTAALAGAYPNNLGMAQDYGPWSPLSTSTTNVDVCLAFSASVTVGGFVTWAYN